MSDKQSPARAAAEEIRDTFRYIAKKDITEATQIITKHYAEREAAHKRLAYAAEKASRSLSVLLQQAKISYLLDYEILGYYQLQVARADSRAVKKAIADAKEKK